MARPANESALPFPPYGSFISFLNDLNAMEILPNLLNQQVFSSSYSGSARHQIIRAFKFFDLVNENNAFNEAALRPLLNPDTRSAALAQLLQEKYAGLVALPLATAGPAEVNNWFNGTGMDAATTRKAKSFFTSAAKANGIKMHSLVVERTARGGGGGAPRKKRKKRNGGEGEGDGNGNGGGAPPFTPRVDGVVFHPAIDMFLREARKITEGENWTAEARKFVVDGFTNQLDLFLPVAKKSKGGPA